MARIVAHPHRALVARALSRLAPHDRLIAAICGRVHEGTRLAVATRLGSADRVGHAASDAQRRRGRQLAGMDAAASLGTGSTGSGFRIAVHP